MAGFVAAECLVGREGFVADSALVRELRGRWLLRNSFSGGRSSAGKHDEAEGKVLFLGRWVLDSGSFGALPLSPGLSVLALDVVFIVERSGCGRRIQSFQGHLFSSVGVGVCFLVFGFLEKKKKRSRGV